jgi:hypothetical protein
VNHGTVGGNVLGAKSGKPLCVVSSRLRGNALCTTRANARSNQRRGSTQKLAPLQRPGGA